MTSANTSPTDLLEAATQALERGEPEVALVACGALLDAHPGHDRGRLLEAEAFRTLHMPDLAEASYRQLLAFHPDHAEAMAGIARVLFDQCAYDEAAIAANLAIRLESPHPEAIHVRAMLREWRGDHAGAARDYARAWTLSPAFPIPEPLRDAELRSLPEQAAQGAGDAALTAWLTSLPVTIEEQPSRAVCAYYQPIATPDEIYGVFVESSPSVILYRRNLARGAARRFPLPTLLWFQFLDRARDGFQRAQIEA